MKSRGVPDNIVLATWPNQVYLHHGAKNLPAYRSCVGASWSDMPTHPTDIRYVRADLVNNRRSGVNEVAELREIVHRFRANGCDTAAPHGNQAEADYSRALELLGKIERTGMTSRPTSTQAEELNTSPCGGANPTMIAIKWPPDKTLVATFESPAARRDDVMAAAGFNEPLLRALAASWASEQDSLDGGDASAGAPSHSTWDDLMDEVRTAIALAYDAGQDVRRQEIVSAAAVTERMANLIEMMRSQPSFDRSGSLAAAADQALAGIPITLLDKIEQVAAALIQDGTLSRLEMSSQQINKEWRDAVRKAKGRLLAPLYFAWSIARLDSTAEATKITSMV
jgi:hypothetical protein